MPFAMVWREPRDHVMDCYFCAVSTTGFNARNKASITYHDLPSARRPVLHCNEMTFPTQEIPVYGSNYSVASTSNEMLQRRSHITTILYIELNDLVRDLNLSKELSELLSSRLAEKTLLQQDIKTSYFRPRYKRIKVLHHV